MAPVLRRNSSPICTAHAHAIRSRFQVLSSLNKSQRCRERQTGRTTPQHTRIFFLVCLPQSLLTLLFFSFFPFDFSESIVCVIRLVVVSLSLSRAQTAPCVEDNIRYGRSRGADAQSDDARSILAGREGPRGGYARRSSALPYVGQPSAAGSSEFPHGDMS